MTNRSFLSFPVRPPGGRVSLFLPIFFLTLSLSKSLKRDWPEVSSSWMTTEYARHEPLRRGLRTQLELGNRKRTILPSQNPSFHLSSPDGWSGCPLTRKPSFYVFVSLSFSDTSKFQPKLSSGMNTTPRRNGTRFSPTVPGTGRAIETG